MQYFFTFFFGQLISHLLWYGNYGSGFMLWIIKLRFLAKFCSCRILQFSLLLNELWGNVPLFSCLLIAESGYNMVTGIQVRRTSRRCIDLDPTKLAPCTLFLPILGNLPPFSLEDCSSFCFPPRSPCNEFDKFQTRMDAFRLGADFLDNDT